MIGSRLIKCIAVDHLDKTFRVTVPKFQRLKRIKNESALYFRFEKKETICEFILVVHRNVNSNIKLTYSPHSSEALSIKQTNKKI